MKVAIIKYNAGNVYSVLCAMRRLGAEAVLTDCPAEILGADRVIFPGVGHARTSMDYLNAHGLSDVIRSLRQPTLGICIGLQLMCRSSEEGARNQPDGTGFSPTQCLGIFDVPVVRFGMRDGLKVPHMGWNSLDFAQDRDGALLRGITPGAYVYYVHSYYAPQCHLSLATTDYGTMFSAVLHRDNFYATQFHPEKSGLVGEQILKNFLEMN